MIEKIEKFDAFDEKRDLPRLIFENECHIKTWNKCETIVCKLDN